MVIKYVQEKHDLEESMFNLTVLDCTSLLTLLAVIIPMFLLIKIEKRVVVYFYKAVFLISVNLDLILGLDIVMIMALTYCQFTQKE